MIWFQEQGPVYFIICCVRVENVLCFLLQVSDVEKILGIVHTENIQVTAEAYDIALDISPGRMSELLKFKF